METRAHHTPPCPTRHASPAMAARTGYEGGVYHTPLGKFSKLDCSTTKRGANAERYMFGKLSARCFQRRSSWHRHYSSCGDIATMENRPGEVWHTVLCKSSRSNTLRLLAGSTEKKLQKNLSSRYLGKIETRERLCYCCIVWYCYNCDNDSVEHTLASIGHLSARANVQLGFLFRAPVLQERPPPASGLYYYVLHLAWLDVAVVISVEVEV